MAPLRTPKCPACGAKFSHDPGRANCKDCGLPDEIASMGPQIIARWKRKNGLKKKDRPASRDKKILAHGRQKQ